MSYVNTILKSDKCYYYYYYYILCIFGFDHLHCINYNVAIKSIDCTKDTSCILSVIVPCFRFRFRFIELRVLVQECFSSSQ